MAQAHEVRLSSADRVVFPDPGLTKGDVFAYYEAVGDAIVPHLRDRPFTMRRFREGIDREGFYQKDAPKGMPAWIPTFEYLARPRGARGDTRLVRFPLVNEVPALLWMVQMHCIEAHVWLSRRDKPDRPDLLMLDLDPPDGRPDLAVRTAHAARELLEEVGLEGFPRTSGGDGMHVVVPVSRRADVRRHRGGRGRHPRDPRRAPPRPRDRHVARRGPRGRRARSTLRRTAWAARWSRRTRCGPRPGAPVATPLEWSEVVEDLQPRTLDHRAIVQRLRGARRPRGPAARAGPGSREAARGAAAAGARGERGLAGQADAPEVGASPVLTWWSTRSVRSSLSSPASTSAGDPGSKPRCCCTSAAVAHASRSNGMPSCSA